MPMAIPLLAAAGGIAAGVAAGATTLVGGLMIAGGVMTGLGAITGNKKLSQLGGIVGLAGGVAGLASGAWSTAAEQVAQQAGTASEAAAPLAGSAAESAGSAAGSAADAAPGSFTFNAGQDSQLASVAKDHTADLVPGAGGSSFNPDVNPVGKNPVGITRGVGASSDINSPLERLGYGARDAASGIIDKARDFGNWVEKNPTLAKMGSGIVSGAMDDVNKQKELRRRFEMEQQMWQQRRDTVNQGNRGVQAPVYVPPKG